MTLLDVDRGFRLTTAFGALTWMACGAPAASPARVSDPPRPVAPPQDPGGACVVGVPPAEAIEKGSGSSLVWVQRFAEPEGFTPVHVAARANGAVALGGILKRGSFGEIHVGDVDRRGPAPFRYVAASYDEKGALGFARVVNAALTSPPTVRVAYDARGLIAAATGEGPVGGAERVIVTAWDEGGKERWQRIFSGPRSVVLDGIVPTPSGNTLTFMHFDERVDGVTFPPFTPSRIRHALIALIDPTGKVERTAVLPVSSVEAIAPSGDVIAVVARVDGPAEIAGTKIRWENERVTASALLTVLDPKTLAARWMTPIEAGLSHPSLAVGRAGEIWLAEARPSAPLRIWDARGAVRPAPQLGPSRRSYGLFVTQDDRSGVPVIVGTHGVRDDDAGAVLTMDRGAGLPAASLPMNVVVLGAAAAGSERLAVLVSSLPPTLHPHCSSGPPLPHAVVVLRR